MAAHGAPARRIESKIRNQCVFIRFNDRISPPMPKGLRAMGKKTGDFRQGERMAIFGKWWRV